MQFLPSVKSEMLNSFLSNFSIIGRSSPPLASVVQHFSVNGIAVLMLL